MQVGQKVWIEHISYNRKDVRIFEGRIDKIGRKYVYAGGKKFHIDTLKEANGIYSGSHRLWLSKQEYDDNMELKKNHWEIRSAFDTLHPTMTLEQSRRILEILEAT